MFGASIFRPGPPPPADHHHPRWHAVSMDPTRSSVDQGPPPPRESLDTPAGTVPARCAHQQQPCCRLSSPTAPRARRHNSSATVKRSAPPECGAMRSPHLTQQRSPLVGGVPRNGQQALSTSPGAAGIRCNGRESVDLRLRALSRRGTAPVGGQPRARSDAPGIRGKRKQRPRDRMRIEILNAASTSARDSSTMAGRVNPSTC